MRLVATSVRKVKVRVKATLARRSQPTCCMADLIVTMWMRARGQDQDQDQDPVPVAAKDLLPHGRERTCRLLQRKSTLVLEVLRNLLGTSTMLSLDVMVMVMRVKATLKCVRSLKRQQRRIHQDLEQ